MGLATQCVDVGTAFGRASQLAESLVKFPQLCLQKDRESVYNSVFNAPNFMEALAFEFNNGKEVITTEAMTGAKQFIQQKLGRHGKFNLNSHNNSGMECPNMLNLSDVHLSPSLFRPEKGSETILAGRAGRKCSPSPIVLNGESKSCHQQSCVFVEEIQDLRR